MINLEVPGRLSVVFLAITLPPWNVVTITFLATGLTTGAGFTVLLVTVLTVAVLRVLVLRGAFGAVAVDLETVDLRGIKTDFV